ncbi:hypothetical protein GCM10025779_21540 [Arthrobacter cryoconiti]
MFSLQHTVVLPAGGENLNLGAHQRTDVTFPSPNPRLETLSVLQGRTPYSEPATDKPSETKAFPQPSSAPLFYFQAQSGAQKSSPMYAVDHLLPFKPVSLS